MSDNATQWRFRSAQFFLQRSLLDYPMYRPLAQNKPLPLHARACIGMEVAIAPMLCAMAAVALVLPGHFAALVDHTTFATALAFIIGWHMDASRAAVGFRYTTTSLVAALHDWVRVLLRKSAHEQRCHRIGRALAVRSDYQRQRIKIWLAHLVQAHGYSAQPAFVRKKLVAGTQQAKFAEMELAERIETAISQLGAHDHGAVLRAALRECAWMDTDRIEAALESSLPTID